jgi:serine/threonine-protein kinase
MIWLSDDIVARLAAGADEPDFTETRYRLVERLDRGGMGIVYAATDLLLERDVAIKVLADPAAGDELATRLEQEAKILAGLEHPGIVPVHDSGVLPDGRRWYVMKRVRGVTLRDHLDSISSLADALRLFVRICEPVAFAHSRGVVHRDLKPDNIMIGASGEVLVMDWGVAKILGDESPHRPRGPEGSRAPFLAAVPTPLTAHGAVVGTRGYMAPEQERGDSQNTSTAADVWALGRVLTELAEGACAHQGSGVPRPLRAIIARATSADPCDRYPTAAELADDVLRLSDGRPVAAYRESILERLARQARTHRTAVAVVLAYLVMRAVLLMVMGR